MDEGRIVCTDNFHTSRPSLKKNMDNENTHFVGFYSKESENVLYSFLPTPCIFSENSWLALNVFTIQFIGIETKLSNKKCMKTKTKKCCIINIGYEIHTEYSVKFV